MVDKAVEASETRLFESGVLAKLSKEQAAVVRRAERILHVTGSLLDDSLAAQPELAAELREAMELLRKRRDSRLPVKAAATTAAWRRPATGR